MTPWLIWLISAIALLVVEVLTGTVAALCLAVGCLIALVPAAAGAGVVVQFIAASVGAVAAFLILSPIISKYRLNRATHSGERSNMDAIIGRSGVVTQPIYPDGRNGRVKVDGDSWLAVAEPEYCPLLPGDIVEIVSYDSIVIKVKPRN